MPNVLDQLARHREYLDDAAPPLILGEVTDRAASTALQAPIRNRAQRFAERRWWASGWAVAAGTAVAVLLLGGALLLITSSDPTGPADTPPSLPPQITESLESAPPPGPALEFESIQPRIDGESVVVAAVANEGWPVVGVPDDGLPVIAFLDQENGLVMVAKCADPDCTAESSLSTVATGSGALAMAVGRQGNPAIVYSEIPESPSTLKLVLCADPECRQTTTVNLGRGGGPVLAIDADGVPLVLFWRETGDSVMFTCGTASCESPSRTIFDSRMELAVFTLRDDGRPIIAGVQEGNLVGGEDNTLSFYSCDDAACTTGSTSATPVIAQGLSVWPLTVNPIALDPDGYPVTVIERYTDMDMTLHYVRCGDPACADTAAITEVQIHGAPRRADSFGASVVIDGDGLPVITYLAGSDLNVARCDNTSCTGAVEVQTLASCVWVRATLAVGGSGTPLVAYQLNPWERDGSVRLLPTDSASDTAGACAGGDGG